MSRAARPVAAVVLALLVLLLAAGSGGTFPRAADPSSVVREVVVGTLASDGTLRSTRVAQLLRVDGKDDVSFVTTSQALPLEVEARYFLNDVEMPASELKGKSGTVRIELTLVNVSDEAMSLTHPAVTSPSQSNHTRVYLPIEYSVLADFPQKTWQRVVAEDAYIRTNERGDELVVRPGVLYPPVGPERDTVVLEATSDAVILPKIRVVASPRVASSYPDALGSQVETVTGLHDGLGAINTNLNSVYEGTLEILAGVEAMLDGVGVLNESTRQPVITLDGAGDPETLVGAIGFIRNVIRDQMLPGIGARDPVTGKPVVTLDAQGNPTTALGALGFIEAVIRDQILAGLGALDPVTGKPVVTLDAQGNPTTAIGALGFIEAVIRDQMLPGIGTRDPVTGQPVITLDAQGNPTTAIGALGFIEAVVRNQMLPALGTRDPATGQPVITLDAQGNPTTVIGALGFMEGVIKTLLLPAIGTTDPDTGRANVAVNDVGQALTLLWGLQSLADSFDDRLIPGAEQMVGGLDPIIGGLGAMRDGLGALSQGYTDGIHPAIVDIRAAAQAGVDATAGDPDPQIQALHALFVGIRDGLDGVSPTIAATGPTLGGMSGSLADPIIPGLGQIRGGLSNPNFKLPQAGLPDEGGDPMVPKDYYQACPNCWNPAHPMFDPNTANPLYHPGFLEAFEMISEGLSSTVGRLHTHDPANPGLVDGLGGLAGGLEALYKQLSTLSASNPGMVEGLGGVAEGIKALYTSLSTLSEADPGLVEGLGQTADGLRALYSSLHTLDAADPGLVEGLGQVAAGLARLYASLNTLDPNDPGLVEGLAQVQVGLDTLVKQLHTFDPDNPGLVDGLQLVRGGTQQLGQGLFAINELGIRTARGQIGETGDRLALDLARLEEAEKLARGTFVGAADAGDSFTTYILEIPGQSTTARDNAVRGALLALGGLGLTLLGRRPRLWFT